ncbi:MAG: adenosine deaminase [Acidobacteriota bacterium]
MSPLSEHIRSLPKAELHVHLEGAATPAILLELSRKYDTEYQSASEEKLVEELFKYKNFHQFLATYKIVCRHLREPADYLRLFSELAGYFESENIRYAEIIYSPSIPWKFERDGREVLLALLEQSEKFQSASGVIVRWILDCVRSFGVEAGWQTAQLAHEFQERGVVAVGLGGDELSLPLQEYQEIFRWVKAHQLYLHMHAGEIGGPEEVWKAVNLGVNRIGHGIQSARDGSLIDYLRDHALALDICLTSNARTGAWPMISGNPFGLLYRRGVPVTLNSDDTGLFQVGLTKEFVKAIQHFDLTRDDVHRILLQGLHSSFLPHDQKMDLMGQFLRGPPKPGLPPS